jgi:leucyl-tRNA synthetase
MELRYSRRPEDGRPVPHPGRVWPVRIPEGEAFIGRRQGHGPTPRPNHQVADSMDPRYNPQDVEAKWQTFWNERGIFKVSEDPERPKYYLLEMFPYPSGKIHMGHVRNYTIGDVVARYKRMQGFNVLHPMGWDAFGMPAENAAIANRTHPAAWTYANIEAMGRQLRRLGFSYDWDREVTTCRPEYYRWEQWLFLKMYAKGMAYRKESFVNWCEPCQTVLANEQVEAGMCWRCGKPVRQKKLWQWFFRITDYAQDLLEHCDRLPGWPEKVLTMQKNWIGRSDGAEIQFAVENSDAVVTVFTTRPDTICGATFMCLAPEHSLVLELAAGRPEEPAVRAFVERVALQDRSMRGVEGLEKEGVFIGAYCLNPMNGRRMPIYTANFALMEYGTGAVMSVPAHDQRDFDFARKYALEIVPVVQPEGAPLEPASMTAAYAGDGWMVNSGEFDGLPNGDAKETITAHLAFRGLGRSTVSYRLRDWGISRQRYWGAPIPMIHCPRCGEVPVPEADLPIVLPEDANLLEGGRSPLPHLEAFARTRCPSCGLAEARRETDTMDTFVESSWYFERYCSPDFHQGMFDPAAVAYWMPVDQYIGGVEHAVMHLLYSRYYTRVLREMGLVEIKEPFTRLLTQGMVCKESLACPTHGFLFPEEVEGSGEGRTCGRCGQAVTVGRVEKMSKSKKNVVDPNDLLERYGADTTRLFCLFAAPPEKDLEWNEQGVEGGFRFLNRVWRLAADWMDLIADALPYDGASRDLPEPLRGIFAKTHETIRKVSRDIEERFHFNTAISAVMELVNLLGALDPGSARGDLAASVVRLALESVTLLLAPIVPHFAEELWVALGRSPSILEVSWPRYREDALVQEEMLVVLQVNGKLRSRLKVSVDTPEAEIKALALADEKVQKFMEGRKPRQVIYVRGKLVNIVV